MFANRYEIAGPLGMGSFGQVFLARDTHQGMDVALKLFRKGSNVIHAYTEAQFLTSLEGSHILRVHNADTFDDIPYIATKVAAEGSADDVLRREPQGLRPDVGLAWIRHLLVGLGSCHAFGLLHRDIKPGNLFLESSDWALLGDFGVAHPLDQNGQAPKHGTPVTMAPEMFTAGRGDVRSDIYSVGVTLYRLLTGRWPFEGPTPAEIERAVVAGRYPRVRDLAPHVSRRLAARVEKAMSYSAEDRYADAREMHDDLANPHIVRRVWQRRDHPDHEACWAEAPTRGSGHQVCVIAEPGGTHSIDVRRTTGARTRVTAFCASDCKASAIQVRLRKVFDNL